MKTVNLSYYNNKIKLKTHSEFNHYEEGVALAKHLVLIPGQKYEFHIDMSVTPIKPYFIKGLLTELYNSGGMESITKNIKFVSDSKAYTKYLSKTVSDAFSLMQ